MFIPSTIKGVEILLGKYIPQSEINNLKTSIRGFRKFTDKYFERKYLYRRLLKILFTYKKI